MQTIQELQAHYAAVRRRLLMAAETAEQRRKEKIEQERKAEIERKRKEEEIAAKKKAAQEVHQISLWSSRYELKVVEIARKHNLTLKEMLINNRQPRYSMPRQEAMYELYSMGLSSPAIGRLLGGRDHSTVLYGIKKYKKFLDAQKNAEAS